MAYKLNPETGKYEYIPDDSNNSNVKVVQNPAVTESELKGVTDNKTEESKNDVFGRGKVKGECDIRKYSESHITGLSKSFEGTYFLSETTHTINASGYTVDFSIKTSRDMIGKKDDTSSGESATANKEQESRTPQEPTNSNKSRYKLDPETGKYTKIS